MDNTSDKLVQPVFAIDETKMDEPKLETETQDIDKELTEEQTFIEAATLAGVKHQKSIILSSYLVSIIDIICDDKESINFNKETIMNKILTSKEKEKDEITDYLKDLTDEERNVENVFKQHKLEKWSIGLQKGLTSYVQENYDDEREKAEKQLLLEKQIAKQSGVNEFNKDIYAYEFEDNSELAEKIDREVYSLTEYQGEDEQEQENVNDPEDYENY